MTFRVLAIGDPHFKVNNVEESLLMTQRLKELASNQSVDLIVCLGDVLDRHETIHVVPLDNAIKCLFSMSQIAPLVVLIGNHDRPNNSHFLTPDHPFQALKYWHNTRIVDTVEFGNYTKDSHDYKFVYVPYVPPGRFQEALETQGSMDQVLQNTQCLFAHQEFYGVQMGPIKSEVGDKWDLNHPLVVSGHIHEEQVLQKNIIYTGTPMQHAFGEMEDKTVSIFDFYPDGRWTRQKVDLKIPKKIVIRCGPHELLEYRKPENCQVKLIVSCTNVEFKTLMKNPRVKELQAQGIKIQWKSTKEYKTVNVEERIPYSQRLWRKIEADQELVQWYHKLFGTTA